MTDGHLINNIPFGGRGGTKPAKKDSRKEVAAASSSKAIKKKSRGGQDDGKKKRKKKKDPNAPKRAMTEFMYYAQVERENLKKSNPGLSFIEAVKICGDKWRMLSNEEKEPYESKAKVDKKRYDDEKNEKKGKLLSQ